MLVPIIDGTKGRQDRCSHRAGGSRLASCLLLTAFRTRDHGKARSRGGPLRPRKAPRNVANVGPAGRRGSVTRAIQRPSDVAGHEGAGAKVNWRKIGAGP